MEKRTEIKVTKIKTSFFEATLSKGSLKTSIVKETRGDLERTINVWLQDNYTLEKVERVERDQVKLS